MARKVIVGMDKGTSSLKAIAIDAETGELLAQAGSKTPSFHPRPGFHEEDMEGTWAKSAHAIRATVQALDPADEVVGVGVTGHMGGVWAIDSEGAPVRPAICWPDARAASILTAANERAADRIFAIGGNALMPGQPYPLLAWLKTSEADVYARIRWVLTAKDWINFKLTGVIATEESDLSYWPSNIVNRGVSSELFEIFGIPEAQETVPPFGTSLELLGSVTAEAAALTGLPAGTPVVAGCGDATANLLGVGVQQDGDATTTLGTSLMNGVLTSSPILAPEGIGFSFLQPEGKWQRQISNSGGGTLCLDWVVETFMPTRANRLGKTVAEAIETTKPGNGGLIFHPYLNTAGATAPFVNVNARGSFSHLRPEAGADNLVRAVLEGTAFAIRDCYEAMPVEIGQIRLTGGGAKSEAWSQVIANVLQSEIVVPDVPESGALGAAMLAAVAVGQASDLAQAADRLVIPGRVHEPDSGWAGVYDEAFAEYRRLLEPLPAIWAESATQTASMEGGDA